MTTIIWGVGGRCHFKPYLSETFTTMLCIFSMWVLFFLSFLSNFPQFLSVVLLTHILSMSRYKVYRTSESRGASFCFSNVFFFLKGESGMTKLISKNKNPLHLVKKVKITEWILGFTNGNEDENESWEMFSSLSRVNMEVSVSKALFPPLHSSPPTPPSLPPLAQITPLVSRLPERNKVKHCSCVDMVTS